KGIRLTRADVFLCFWRVMGCAMVRVRARRGELARECEGGGARARCGARRVRGRRRGAVRGEYACGSDLRVVRARHRRTAANFKFKIAAQECGQRRMKTAMRECEQRHWTGNTCLHCSSMGAAL